MGLWGSKQPRTVVIENKIAGQELYVSEDALTNIAKSVNQKNNNETKQDIPDNRNSEKKLNSELDLRLSPDMSDKRIIEYEKFLKEGFNKSSKEVEELFRERYKTFPVCLDLQKNVGKCYSENPNQPLNCLDISNKFIKCVEQERLTRFGLSSSSSK